MLESRRDRLAFLRELANLPEHPDSLPVNALVPVTGTPLGDRVRITLEYDGDIKLPADAKAVMISPSVVGDRFIQLGPAYTGGPALPDNARLGIDRTAVPVELDDMEIPTFIRRQMD